MIRDIVKDMFFLGRKSEDATRNDTQIGYDLMDTLERHKDECVGMAANMIGFRKNIIIVNAGILNIVMFNPVITKMNGEYEAEEGCLSLSGKRKTKRYREIEVEYFDMNFNRVRAKFRDFTAQIIQHEVDHLHGIII